jgi:hypothetical protein
MGWNRACQVLFGGVPATSAGSALVIVPSSDLPLSFDDVFAQAAVIPAAPAVTARPLAKFDGARFQHVLKERQTAFFAALRGIVYFVNAGEDAGLRDEAFATKFCDGWREASAARLTAMRTRVETMIGSDVPATRRAGVVSAKWSWRWLILLVVAAVVVSWLLK